MFIGVPNSANGTSGQPNITSVHFRGSLAPPCGGTDSRVPWRTRLISTARLKPLLALHLPPINHVVSMES